MHFQKSALGFLVAALAALPSGARPAEASIDAQLDSGHVFVCTEIGFSGLCANMGFVGGVCNNLSDAFQDNISSFGPDFGWLCTMFTDPNCQGSALGAVNPGFSSLPAGFNDAFSSFQCVPT